jgi:hypothetical protein
MKILKVFLTCIILVGIVFLLGASFGWFILFISDLLAAAFSFGLWIDVLVAILLSAACITLIYFLVIEE